MGLIKKILTTFTFSAIFIFLFAFPVLANVFTNDFTNFQTGDLECYGFACGEWTPYNGMAYSDYTGAFFTRGQAPLIVADTFSMEIEYKRAEGSTTSTANFAMGVGTDEYIYCTHTFDSTFFSDGEWHTIKIRSTGNEDIFWSVDGGIETYAENLHCTGGYTYYGLGQSSGLTESWIDNLLITGVESDEEDWVQEWFTFNDTRPDFYSPLEDICFLDKNCTITLYYNNLAIGSTIHLIPDDGRPKFSEYSELSFIIPDTYLNEHVFNYPFIYEDATTTKYCLLLESPIGDILKCGMKTRWVSEDIYLVDMVGENYCEEEIVCADVDGSSFLYGIECGFKRVICWSFKPSVESMETFSGTVGKLEKSFPFNTVFSILNYAKENIEEKTSGGNVGGEFGIIMIDENKEVYTMNFIDENTYVTTLGSATVEMIETFADYIIWLVVGIIIIFIVVKYSILY